MYKHDLTVTSVHEASDSENDRETLTDWEKTGCVELPDGMHLTKPSSGINTQYHNSCRRSD